MPERPRHATPPLAPQVAPPPASPGDRVPAGIALMVAFALLAPWIDVLAKLASGIVPPLQLSLGRFAVQAIALLPLAAALGGWRPGPGMMRLHAARGVLMALASTAFITAVQAMPLADAMAIFFVAPLALTAVCGLLLGEPVGWRRYTACAVGFAGAMIVVRPSFAALGPVSLLPLVTAAAFVAYILLTRRVARTEGPIAMQGWSGAFGTLAVGAAMLLAAPFGWAIAAPVWPDAAGWALLLAVGAVATASHLFLVAAYARAPAPVLAPLQYLEIATATVFGLLLFGDFPDAIRWLGIAIIVASGLYVIWRERRA